MTLVRAHLAATPIIVLDEATCHLDPAAEEKAERAFMATGSTLIGRASHVGDVACEEGDGDGRRWHRCRRPPPTDAETCALRGLSLHVVGTNNGATGVRIPIWVAPHVLQHRTCEHRRPSPGTARHASRRPPVGTSATGPAARQRTQAADLPAMGRDRPMRAASFALAMQPSRGSSRRIARSEWSNGFDSALRDIEEIQQ